MSGGATTQEVTLETVRGSPGGVTQYTSLPSVGQVGDEIRVRVVGASRVGSFPQCRDSPSTW